MARGKYEAYAGRGMTLLGDDEVRNFGDTVRDHVILGDAESCRQQIADIAAALPIGPLLVRPHWPGMDAEQTEAYLERVGREIVTPLRELQSRSFSDFLETSAA
ncbi:hypothetical protein ACFSVJ_04735 [Prauserella oleivorans]